MKSHPPKGDGDLDLPLTTAPEVGKMMNLIIVHILTLRRYVISFSGCTYLQKKEWMNRKT